MAWLTNLPPYSSPSQILKFSMLKSCSESWKVISKQLLCKLHKNRKKKWARKFHSPFPVAHSEIFSVHSPHLSFPTTRGCEPSSPSKNLVLKRKEMSLQKNKNCQTPSSSPTSTRPWNSQQIASFAILLALPTLQGRKTFPQGFEACKWRKSLRKIWVDEELRKARRKSHIYICVYAENRKGCKAMCL